MKVLTQAEIYYILKKAKAAFRHNQMPKKWEKEFLTTLRAYLSKRGIIEDVCPFCLGTGRAKERDWEKEEKGDKGKKKGCSN